MVIRFGRVGGTGGSYYISKKKKKNRAPTDTPVVYIRGGLESLPPYIRFLRPTLPQFGVFLMVIRKVKKTPSRLPPVPLTIRKNELFFVIFNKK